jgi:hypothetical protein
VTLQVTWIVNGLTHGFAKLIGKYLANYDTLITSANRKSTLQGQRSPQSASNRNVSAMQKGWISGTISLIKPFLPDDSVTNLEQTHRMYVCHWRQHA